MAGRQERCPKRNMLPDAIRARTNSHSMNPLVRIKADDSISKIAGHVQLVAGSNHL